MLGKYLFNIIFSLYLCVIIVIGFHLLAFCRTTWKCFLIPVQFIPTVRLYVSKELFCFCFFFCAFQCWYYECIELLIHMMHKCTIANIAYKTIEGYSLACSVQMMKNEIITMKSYIHMLVFWNIFRVKQTKVTWFYRFCFIFLLQ